MNKERKRKENEFRKEMILAAAEKIFGKKPYDEVSVIEISKESGVCLQSIYNNFGSKKNLYKNIIFFRINKFKKEVDVALKEKSDSLSLLKKWTEVFFESMQKFPQFFPVFLKERMHYEWGIKSPLFSELKEIFEKEEERLIALLKKAQREKYLKEIPVQYLKLLFFANVQSKLEYHFKVKKCFEVKECVEEIFSNFLYGLKG